MPKMLEDKRMKRGNCEVLYSKNMMACKWMDNWHVLLVSTALEVMDGVSSVQRREKRSSTKTAIPCPTAVKLCNNGMGGIDLTDKRIAAYQLSFLSTHFLWSVRYCLYQQFPRTYHEASETINIAQLQNRHT